MKIPRDGGAFEKTRNPIKNSQVIYANRFTIFPFTCILDRLLGPCFKTGPKGIPNVTVVDRAHNKTTPKRCRNIRRY